MVLLPVAQSWFWRGSRPNHLDVVPPEARCVQDNLNTPDKDESKGCLTQPEDECVDEEQCFINVPTFWIDQTEVTNKKFAEFLNEKGNLVDGKWIALDIDDEEGQALIELSESDNEFQAKEGFADHPVIEVTWYGAEAYCKWARRRLPSKIEWEKAARGIDGRIYPWGNEPPNQNLLNFDPEDTMCNSEYCDVFSIKKVGSYLNPSDGKPRSYYGALDMAGNVWEWTANEFDDNKNNQGYTGPSGNSTDKEMRGGSWTNDGVLVRPALRAGETPDTSNHNTAFRCATSSP